MGTNQVGVPLPVSEQPSARQYEALFVDLYHLLHLGVLSLQLVLVALYLLLLVAYKILLLSPYLFRSLEGLEELLVVNLQVLVFDAKSSTTNVKLIGRVS